MTTARSVQICLTRVWHRCFLLCPNVNECLIRWSTLRDATVCGVRSLSTMVLTSFSLDLLRFVVGKLHICCDSVRHDRFLQIRF